MQGGVKGGWGAAGIPLGHHGTGGEGGDVSLERSRGGGVLRNVHVQDGGVSRRRRRRRGRVGRVLEVTREGAKAESGEAGKLLAGDFGPAAWHPGNFRAGL